MWQGSLACGGGDRKLPYAEGQLVAHWDSRM